VQEAFYQAGAEASEKNLIFEKQGSEPVGLNDNVAIESGKEVVAVIEENLGVIKSIEEEAGLRNSTDLGTFESREFKELSPQEKASKNIAKNLAKIAEKDPNGAATKIQQLTGITLDAGELITTTRDKQNLDVLEAIAQELLKNFEFRVQEPTTADSFGFIVLDTNNLTRTQQANFDFLKDLSMGPGYDSTIKNYSLENNENKVIAYTKEFAARFEKREGEIEKGQDISTANVGDQSIKRGVEAQTEKVDNPAKYQPKTVEFNYKSFKLPDQIPVNIKAQERLAKLKTEGVSAYKASRVNAQPI
jgi:hypothetical protein